MLTPPVLARLCRSKFRNVECRPLPREQSFDQLQAAPDGGGALAVAPAAFAFPHQLDGGGAVQVKRLADSGKEPATTVRHFH